MSRKRTRKTTEITGDNDALSTNPFAAALGEFAGEPLESPRTGDPPQNETSTEAPLDPGRRAIVRRQSKGQGGKTVTCIEGLPEATMSTWLPDLKRELGCSGRIDEGVLILGTRDHARVAGWLRTAGVPRVTLGN